MSSAPVFDHEGQIRRVIGVYDDITRLVAAQTASEIRAAQQDFVATTGSLSLRGHSSDELVEVLPEQLARILKIEFVKVLLYHPETGDFSLEASLWFPPAQRHYRCRRPEQSGRLHRALRGARHRRESCSGEALQRASSSS
jgi:hypothetical protein